MYRQERLSEEMHITITVGILLETEHLFSIFKYIKQHQDLNKVVINYKKYRISVDTVFFIEDYLSYIPQNIWKIFV